MGVDPTFYPKWPASCLKILLSPTDLKCLLWQSSFAMWGHFCILNFSLVHLPRSASLCTQFGHSHISWDPRPGKTHHCSLSAQPNPEQTPEAAMWEPQQVSNSRWIRGAGQLVGWWASWVFSLLTSRLYYREAQILEVHSWAWTGKSSKTNTLFLLWGLGSGVLKNREWGRPPFCSFLLTILPLPQSSPHHGSALPVVPVPVEDYRQPNWGKTLPSGPRCQERGPWQSQVSSLSCFLLLYPEARTVQYCRKAKPRPPSGEEGSGERIL